MFAGPEVMTAGALLTKQEIVAGLIEPGFGKGWGFLSSAK